MLKKFKNALGFIFASGVLASLSVWAEGEADTAAAAGGTAGGMIGMIAPLVIMVAIFYFLLIRPQRKKDKALREMISNLKVGDKVASIGGINGKIVRIKDDVFVLESGVGTMKSYISLDRSAISRLVKKGSDASAESEVASIPDDEPADNAADTDNE